MRSYKEHLNSATHSIISSKGVFRASGLFPVFQDKDFSSRLLFMGYWMLKREISNLSGVLTLRSSVGALLSKTIFSIDQVRAYRFELGDELLKIGLDVNAPFIGSMEIEFFSAKNLVFPFPAVTLNYYGPHFSTMVHTAQRVFNDFEDMGNVMKVSVPESGFNLFANENTEPFLTMVNGLQHVPDAKVDLVFYNEKKEVLYHQERLGNLYPYQTTVLYPKGMVDLETFLHGKPGAAKIQFNLPWTFPRLIVGNRHHRPTGAVITHTYYDCSEALTEGDYWYPSQEGWHDAVLGIPVLLEGPHTTCIDFYPIYTPSSFVVGVEFYNRQGEKLAEKKNLIAIDPAAPAFYRIDFKALSLELGLDGSVPCLARITADATRNRPIPARIKVALDIGASSQFLPCNICTNLIPFNPKTETKTRTFRWFPILEQPGASAWIINSGPQVDYLREAHVTLTFYREQDTKTMTREITLAAHGFFIIERDRDEELSAFLGEGTGWITAVADNPHVITYYFVMHPSGIVGGDHGF